MIGVCAWGEGGLQGAVLEDVGKLGRVTNLILMSPHFVVGEILLVLSAKKTHPVLLPSGISGS